MKKRIFKQGVALMLAAVLALPANVVPAEILDQKTGTEKPHIVLRLRYRRPLTVMRNRRRRGGRSFIISAPSMFML